MFLIIDTSSSKTIVALAQDKQVKDCYIWDANLKQSEELLPHIEKLLLRNKVSLRNLDGIIVNKGPGSYTGLRVGITTANALSFALDISIAGISIKNQNLTSKERLKILTRISKKSSKKPIRPFYSRPPHITKRKKCLI